MQAELKNLFKISDSIKPLSGEIPKLDNIDVYGEVIPFNGIVGGDHIIYVDFNQRYDIDQRIKIAKDKSLNKVADNLKKLKNRAGILLADVAGHNMTDVLLTAMLHQAFLTGVQYELKQNGEITTELFEILNTRFFNSSSISKFITLLYGEIDDRGKFRFINAGHPAPIVFSYKKNKVFRIDKKSIINFPPIGTLPSKEDIDSIKNFSRLGYKRKYSSNEIELMGNGDIMILYTDGFCEHNKNMKNFYIEERLEEVLIKIKNKNAKEIFDLLKEDIINFSKPDDDLSLVIIKRNLYIERNNLNQY